MRRSIQGAQARQVDNSPKLFDVFIKGNEAKGYTDGAKVSDVFNRCDIQGEGNKKLLTARVDKLGYAVTTEEENKGITVQGFIDKFLENINKSNGTNFKATYDPDPVQSTARYY